MAEQSSNKKTTGLTPERIDQLTDKFCSIVKKKMDVEGFDTETVHEDIRIMHHLAKLNAEVSGYLFLKEEIKQKIPKGETYLFFEKIDQLADRLFNRVMEKMDTKGFDTKMVHEDIRIMHHLAIMKIEIGDY